MCLILFPKSFKCLYHKKELLRVEFLYNHAMICLETYKCYNYLHNELKIKKYICLKIRPTNVLLEAIIST